MKMFFSVLAAILVAALLIGGFFLWVHVAHEAAVRQANISAMTLENEISHAQRMWETRFDKDRGFDPSAEKLSAELRRIHEASEKGVLRSSDKDYDWTAPTPVPVVVRPTQTPTAFAVAVRDIPIRIDYGDTVIKTGTRLELISQSRTTAKVIYLGRSHDVPADAVRQ